MRIAPSRPGLEQREKRRGKSPKKKLRIWFTDDAWRRPVRFYSEVAVGSFTTELRGWRGPKPEVPSILLLRASAVRHASMYTHRPI